MSAPRLPHKGREITQDLFDVAKVARVSPVRRIRRRALRVGVEFTPEFFEQGVYSLPALPVSVRRRGGPFGLVHVSSPAIIYPIHRLHVGGKSSFRRAAGNGPQQPLPARRAAHRPTARPVAARGATSAACAPNGGAA